MKAISAIVLSIILFVSLALIPAISSAQNENHPGNTYMNSDADTGTSLLNGTTNGTASRFDPMWLLPLLIVPVAYVIYKAANNDFENSDYDRTSPFIGAKGGKATKKSESEMENFDE